MFKQKLALPLYQHNSNPFLIKQLWKGENLYPKLFLWMLKQPLAINFFLVSCNVCPVANTRIQLPTIYSLCSGHWSNCTRGKYLFVEFFFSQLFKKAQEIVQKEEALSLLMEQEKQAQEEREKIRLEVNIFILKGAHLFFLFWSDLWMLWVVFCIFYSSILYYWLLAPYKYNCSSDHGDECALIGEVVIASYLTIIREVTIAGVLNF